MRPLPRWLPVVLGCVWLSGAAAGETWDPTPLGPDVAPPPFRPAPVRRRIEPTLHRAPAQGEPVTLVRDGTARAVIVLADRPERSALDAAEALQEGIERISGARLPMIRESAVAATPADGGLAGTAQGEPAAAWLLVGDSALIRALGVDTADLPPEGYRIRTLGNCLIVAGSDRLGEHKRLFGTRHAAYALLERHLGFRWLWPGDEGEIAPAASTVAIGPVDERDAPALAQRRMRNHGASGARYHDPATPGEEPVIEGDVRDRTRAGLDRLGFTSADFLRWHRHTPPWFARQRLGSSLELRYTHAYAGMWNRFGADHPDWFALQPRGDRRQRPERERLCVSNEALIEQIARDKIRELRENPHLDAASISPNDGSGHNTFCLCENCRRLDPPQAPQITIIAPRERGRDYVDYVSLTDRYLTFYSRIAERVAQEVPDRWLGAYAYSAYRSAPLYARAHPNLLIPFVGLTYFSDEHLERDRESWERWAQAAEQFMLRPNLLHGGHGFPAVYVTKLAADIRRFYETGMLATDFDSVMHHWATQGLNYYVLAKLLWDPGADVEALVEDYCRAGFGPAASHVRRYFREVEDLTSRIAAELEPFSRAAMRAEEVDWESTWGGREAQFFTPDRIAALRAILAEAGQAADGDAAIAGRIEFLRAGLRYAEVQHAIREALRDGDRERGAALLAERHAVFGEIFERHPLAVNVTQISWREGPVFQRAFRTR